MRKAKPEHSVGSEKQTYLRIVGDVSALMADKKVAEQASRKVCRNDQALDEHDNFEWTLQIRIDMQKACPKEDDERAAKQDEKTLHEQDKRCRLDHTAVVTA